MCNNIKIRRQKMPKRWTELEDQIIRDNYPAIGTKGCLDLLPDRTDGAIKARASNLKVRSNKIKDWTYEEEKFLLDNWATKGSAYCAEKLNKKSEAIRSKAAHLGLKSNRYWPEKDKQFLRDNYPIYGGSYCAEKLQRPIESIRKMASSLKIKSKNNTKPWSEDEVQFLQDNYSENGADYCAKHLPGRNANYIRVKASSMRLSRLDHYWTPEEEQFLIENYGDSGAASCADMLNRTFRAVRDRALLLGIKNGERARPLTVYTCYFPEIDLYKCGITHNWESRSKQFGYEAVLLEFRSFSTEKEAREYEKHLLASNTEYQLNSGLLRSGNTETFTNLKHRPEMTPVP
jgi:hypothetical protein